MNAAKTCAACGCEESQHDENGCKACEQRGLMQCPGFRALVGLGADAFRVGALLEACRELFVGTMTVGLEIVPRGADVPEMRISPEPDAPFVVVRRIDMDRVRAALDEVPPPAPAHAAAIAIAKRVVADHLAKGNEIGNKISAAGAMAVVDALEHDRRDLPETKDEKDEREALDELENLGETILADLLTDEALAKTAHDPDAVHKLREFFLACMDYFRAVRGGRR